MRIAIVNKRYFESTGPERYMFAISEEFEKNGHSIFPFAVRYKFNKKSPYEKYFVSPPAEDGLYYKDYKDKLSFLGKLRILSNSVYSFEAKRKMGKLIDDFDVDLVYVLPIETAISPSIIDSAKKRGVPVVMRASDFFIFCAERTFVRNGRMCRECEDYGYKRALKYKCLQDSIAVTGVRVLSMYIHRLLRIYDKVDAFIAPSLCMRDAFIKGGFPPEKVHHIPSFFDASSVKPCYENDGYVLYFGRLDKDKGLIHLIKAYEKGRFDAPLLIAGDSSDGEDQRLKEYVLEKKIPNIKFAGFKNKDELIPLIQRAAFTVVPSIWPDNSPMSVLEAMVCGKPVIGSNLGGIAEQITHETGVLVPPCDPEALADAIDMLLSNPEKLVSMGMKGRGRAEQEYSIGNHYNKLSSIFERLVEKKTEKR
ncbi:MAG: glycosyltransferase family 4 protein [Nitrospirae bacterium]|nr:glycosyltransferase family 4 protein [Nitrospirota bacterium]